MRSGRCTAGNGTRPPAWDRPAAPGSRACTARPSPSMRNENFLSQHRNSFFFWVSFIISNLNKRNQRNKGINEEANQNIYPGFGSSDANLLQGAPGPWPLLVVWGWDLVIFFNLFDRLVSDPQDKREENQRNDGELQPHRIPTELLPDPAL